MKQPILLGSTVGRTMSRFRGRGSDIRTGAELAKVWSKVIGEPLGRFCFPVDIQGKTLTIGVTNAVWKAEIEYLRETLLANLDTHLGKKRITSIRLRMLARPPATFTPPKPATPMDPVPTVPKALSPAQEEHLNRDLEQIKDPELRERMRRVLLKALTLAP
jgi:hypothetical protein